LVITFDFGTWHIEYIVVPATNPLASGAIENIAFTVAKPGHLMAVSCYGIGTTALGTSDCFVQVTNDSNVPLVPGVFVGTLRARFRNPGSTDMNFPNAAITLWIRNRKIQT